MRTHMSSTLGHAGQSVSSVGRLTTNALSGIRRTVGDAVVLGIACLVSYSLIARILGRAYFPSRDDELLGGMWAVVATVFVYRHSYQQSVSAALSRTAATLLSFALCLVYLLIFPFHAWGMAALIGIGAVVMPLIGRSEDIITTGITTAVVMVVAGMSPEHAWKTPILRLIDTVVGTAVAIVAVWIAVVLAGRVPRDWFRDNLQQSRGGRASL